MRLKFTQVLVAFAILAALVFVPKPGRAQPGAQEPVYARGYVFAQVRDRFEKAIQVALPHAVVFLANPQDLAKPLASSITDLSGHFQLRADDPGVYMLCVKAEGFADNCVRKEFRVSSDLGHVLIQPVQSDKTAAIYGSISLRRGRLARGFEPFMNVNAFTTIEMQSNQGSYKGFVNNHGEYIVPNIPNAEKFKFRASIENENLEREIFMGTLIPNLGYKFDFRFSNSAPTTRLVSASLNNKLVQQVAPGNTITLTAVSDDSDADSLEYRWLLPEGGGTVGPNTTPELSWKVPSRNGLFTVVSLVGDRRGGYTRSTITVRATNGGVPFNGTVVDANGKPVAGAQVDVNGRLTNSDLSGHVELEVPVGDKYVLNIRQPGVSAPGQAAFGTASFVYTSSVVGERWVLRRSAVTTFDPTKAITFQHKRDEKDCAAARSRSSQIDWKQYSQPGLFEWQDGRGNPQSLSEAAFKDPKAARQIMRLLAKSNPVVARVFAQAAKVEGQFETSPVPCRNGIKVEIPANALENPKTKKAPTGPVQIGLSTIDLNSPTQMPGDYSALDGNGKLAGMASFGAGSIDVGAGNQRFNLKPGMTAKVTIPVDGTQLTPGATLPTKIPFLYYNEQTGVWKQEGEAVLTGSGANAAYVAKAKHFSTMNADILKTGESCVAVEVDPAAGFSFPLNVEVNLQPSVVNPTAVQVRTLTINSSGEHSVIYNLPNKQDIALTPIIPGVLPDGSSGNVPAGIFVVNTGGPQTSPSAPPTPNADGTYYKEVGGNPVGPCGSRVTLKKLNGAQLDPQYEFLQGLYFESSNITEFAVSDPSISSAIEAGSDDYYAQSDPRQQRLTLAQFQAFNRFGQAQNPATGEVEFSAVYANSGDLGFGREMHCRRNVANDSTIATPKFDYACYVTNYGQPPLFRDDQTDADEAAKGPVAGHADATVTMEYSRVENAPGDPIEFPDNERTVKFYAYNTLTGVRVKKADLDGHGERPIPQLCVICHGGKSSDTAADPLDPSGPKKGAYTARSDMFNKNSKFLPFDLHYYKFPATKPKATQQNDFRNLNLEIVKQVANDIAPSSPIGELIDAWYPGGAGDQQEAKVIAGWDTGGAGNPNHQDNQMYRDVFARACRTCHVAQPYSAPNYVTVAQFKADIGKIQSRICREKVMPHAQRTNDIFWSSLNPNMPGFLEIFGQGTGTWSTAPNDQCGLFFQPGSDPKSFFESQIYPILTKNCQSCHGSVGLAQFAVTTPAATYNALLNTPTNAGGSSRYIVPNNLGSSVLYQRITTGAVGVRMPKFGADLTTTDTDVPPDGKLDANEVKDWITTFNATGP